MSYEPWKELRFKNIYMTGSGIIWLVFCLLCGELNVLLCVFVMVVQGC